MGKSSEERLRKARQSGSRQLLMSASIAGIVMELFGVLDVEI
jgi:hypothetical protein